MFNKKWEIEVVGALATDEYVEEKTGQIFAVFVNSQNSIQFNVRSISDTPEGFPNVPLYTAYASDIEPYGFEEDFYASRPERAEMVREFLADKLIVFQPHRRMTSGGHEVYQAKEVRLVTKPYAYRENTQFVGIPVFSKQRHGQTFDEFMDKLWSNKFVGRIDKISTESADTPSVILWKSDDESYTVIGGLEQHRYAHGGFAFQFKELKITAFREEWIDDAIEGGDLLFVGYDTYRHMNQLLEASAPEVAPMKNELPDVVHAVAESYTGVTTYQGPVETYTAQPSVPVFTDDEEYNEDAFLQQLMQMARDRSLLYEDKDMINFHTSMKSSNLVILAGMSGTGKSRLVELYGRALGMDDQQLTIIPVRPSWTDDADLIGYVDSMHNVYRPGDSGLVNVLLHAAKEENRHNKLYIVCFDEMNLARVEHYFSQFISVLESPPSRRQLRLYNDELENRLHNSTQYPPLVPIGENVMFVGTVNLDESTYHFSDKVLDRANVISLHVLPFRQLKALRERKNDRRLERKNWSFRQFQEMKNYADGIQLNERELGFLEELHTMLQAVNKNLGVGFRVVRQMDAYLKNLPARHALQRDEAFDLQVVQRILTKLRGPEDLLKALIGTIQMETGEITNSRLLNLLEAYQDISRFAETRLILAHKAKELRLHGYTV